MGNYLSLYPLWGQYNCTDDYVFDTPIHNYPNFYQTEYKHISTCDGLPVEMLSNFMDNTDDQYLHFFTHGQKARMQAMLAEGGPRYGLLKGGVACQDVEDFELGQPIDLGEDVSLKADPGPAIRLFPNPADQITNLEISALEEGMATIKVFDLTGRLQHAQEIELVAGRQRIPINCQDWSIYFFHVLIGGITISGRLVIN